MNKYALIALGLIFIVGTHTAFADTALCKEDSECVIVQEGCCSCNNGGRNTAILKTDEQAWKTKLAGQCADTMCPAVISTDKTCFNVAKCVDGKCEAANAN